jgi:hypothetical protein
VTASLGSVAILRRVGLRLTALRRADFVAFRLTISARMVSQIAGKARKDCLS